jgi:hypothetical protein
VVRILLGREHRGREAAADAELDGDAVPGEVVATIVSEVRLEHLLDGERRREDERRAEVRPARPMRRVLLEEEGPAVVGDADDGAGIGLGPEEPGQPHADEGGGGGGRRGGSTRVGAWHQAVIPSSRT